MPEPTAPPKLRLLDVRPQLHNGEVYLLLRDPLNLSERMLLVPQPAAGVLAFCDGEHDARAMATAFTRATGMPLEPALVEGLLAALDDALLLDNERSAAARGAALEAYRAAPARPALLADRGYPADPAALHALLNDLLETVDVAPRPAEQWPSRVGLLSPHIDYDRGGLIYAQVWKEAAEAVRGAELAVLLGTDHYGDDPITLTRQDYATPYGVLPTEGRIVEALAAELGEDAVFAGELRHRSEHSLEMVAVWLHHMRRGQPLPVVPILAGPLTAGDPEGGEPGNDARLQRLLATLDRLAGDRRLLVVASGDLAHVGPAFGGAALTAAARRELRQADEALIAQMAAGDAEGFQRTIAAGSNANNICGMAPIYLTLRLLAEGADCAPKGERFGYAVCPADEHNTSAVTICGMVFS